MINLSERWKTIYPGASVGLLAMNHVQNLKGSQALAERKKSLELGLIEKYAGFERSDLKALPTLAAYNQYYKRFKKSYHVQLQLESVVFKGKSIPQIASLVEAMFIAELDNLLLTAGHDLARVHEPLIAGIADGDETFVGINGQTQALKKEDLYITDDEGILSTIIYGPDKRTKIQPDTTEVMFTVYGVPGIGETAIKKHLEDIEYYVRLASPDAATRVLEVIQAPH